VHHGSHPADLRPRRTTHSTHEYSVGDVRPSD
jgi:hypothetical protein